MNCPACGSTLQERKSQKGVTHLVCSNYPGCNISGTPALFEAMQRPAPGPRGQIRLGEITGKLAQLRILQSQLSQAKTAEERARLREKALEVMK